MITSNSPIDFASISAASGGTDEFASTPEFKDWITNLLSDSNPTTITFTKKDGTLRVMRCTRNVELIPSVYIPLDTASSTRKVSTTSVSAFDLDKQEWRSFLPQNITHINYEF